jgi:hypothetical protein
MNEQWANLLEYFRSIEKEILLRSERIRLLIGAKHWLTDGRHKEELIKNAVTRYCGEHIIATNGFICSFNYIGRSSPEVDVLILNRSESASYYDEGGVVIAPPSRVGAHLHVKTTLSLPAVKDVFRTSVRSNEEIRHSADPDPVFSAGIFFRTPHAASNTTILNWIGEEAVKVKDPSCLPNAIFMLGTGIAVIRLDDNSKRIKVSIHSIEYLSIAWLVSEILDALKAFGVVTKNDIVSILASSPPNKIEHAYFDV